MMEIHLCFSILFLEHGVNTVCHILIIWFTVKHCISDQCLFPVMLFVKYLLLFTEHYKFNETWTCEMKSQTSAVV